MIGEERDQRARRAARALVQNLPLRSSACERSPVFTKPNTLSVSRICPVLTLLSVAGFLFCVVASDGETYNNMTAFSGWNGHSSTSCRNMHLSKPILKASTYSWPLTDGLKYVVLTKKKTIHGEKNEATLDDYISSRRMRPLSWTFQDR